MSDPAPTTPAPRPKILFLHQTYGAQFEFFGEWLAKKGWDVTYLHRNPTPKELPEGVRAVLYRLRELELVRTTHFAYPAWEASAHALGAAEQMYQLRHSEGYLPDVVMAHTGWGVGLCAKQIFPEAPYIAFHEWFYSNLDFDTGVVLQPRGLLSLASERMRNLPISAEFDCADAHWSPTRFQASRFPQVLRKMINVVHDGVNTDFFRPDPEAKLDFDWLDLSGETKILTYATRGMEPIRGFPQFMRGLKDLQKRRSDFHCVILADDTVSYGSPLPEGDSWRLRMMHELNLDLSRVHVFGMRKREEYQRVLQASTAHVYFTEPFVTSWSLTEALSTGCLVIGSRTEPVQEMITDEENGLVVDMDDPEEIADMIEWVFDNPEEAAALRREARRRVIDAYDSEKIFRMKEGWLLEMINRPELKDWAAARDSASR